MIKKFIKGFISGLIATVFDISIVYIFTEYIGFRYIRSAVLGFSVGCIINFILHVYIVFGKNKIIMKDFLKFIIFSIFGILITIALMYILVDIFFLNYMYAKVISALLVYIMNFILRKNFIFNDK